MQKDNELRRVVSAAVEEYRQALDEVYGRVDVREEADRLAQRVTDALRGTNFMRVRFHQRERRDVVVPDLDGLRVEMVAYPECGSWFGMVEGASWPGDNGRDRLFLCAPMHADGGLDVDEIGEPSWGDIDDDVEAMDRRIMRDFRDDHVALLLPGWMVTT